MEHPALKWIKSNIHGFTQLEDLSQYIPHMISKLLLNGSKNIELRIKVLPGSDKHSSMANLNYALQLLQETSLKSEVQSINPLDLHQDPNKQVELAILIYNSQPNLTKTALRKPPKSPMNKIPDQLYYVDEPLSIELLDIRDTDPQNETANNVRIIKPQSPYTQTVSKVIQIEKDPNAQFETHQTNFSNFSERSFPQIIQQSQSQSYEVPIDFKNSTLGMQKEQKKGLSPIHLSKFTPIKTETSFQTFSNTKSEGTNKQIFNLSRNEREKTKIPQQQQSSSTFILENKENIRTIIPKISMEDKMATIQWMLEIRLLKATSKDLELRLPEICKDGWIFFDLLNRLSGREEVLNGAIRKPKSQNQIILNYRRVLTYLKNFEKFNTRTFGNEYYISQDDNLFWALLVDIRQLFCYQSTVPILNKTQFASTTSCIQPTRIETSQMDANKNNLEITIQTHRENQFNFSPATYTDLSKSRRRSSSKKNQYVTPVKTPVASQIKFYSASKQFQSKWHSEQKSLNFNIVSQHVTKDMELYVQNYFKSLPQTNQVLSLQTDPARNGQLLITLLDRNEQQSTKQSRSIIDIEYKIQEGLDLVHKLLEKELIPVWCGQVIPADIMQSNKSAMGLYWHLIKYFDRCINEANEQMALDHQYNLDQSQNLKLSTLVAKPLSKQKSTLSERSYSQKLQQSQLMQAQNSFSNQKLRLVREHKKDSSQLLIAKLTPIKKELSFQSSSNSKLEKLQKDILILDQLIEKEKPKQPSNNQSTSYMIENKENIRPSVPTILVEEKLAAIQWMLDIRLLKASSKDLELRLPEICKDGWIFFDLLNRLSGREEVLNGAIRKPKSQNQIILNYRRVFSYLRGFERFNPRTFGSETFIIQDQNLFWALLIDIKQLFSYCSTSSVQKLFPFSSTTMDVQSSTMTMDRSNTKSITIKTKG